MEHLQYPAWPGPEKRRERCVSSNSERSSLQFEANIFVVIAPENNLKEDGVTNQDARVMMLRGTLSKYVEELEMAPG